MKQKPYLNPYLAGLLLGLVMLVAFYVSGKGIGFSGAYSQLTAEATHIAAPGYAESNPYLERYYVEQEGPKSSSRLLFLALGAVVGGLFSGLLGGRVRKEVEKGPGIGVRNRLLLALSGGVLIGFAARLARGCTSGQGLSGAAMLSLGSWVFLLSIFAGGFAVAYFFRKQWV